MLENCGGTEKLGLNEKLDNFRESSIFFVGGRIKLRLKKFRPVSNVADTEDVLEKSNRTFFILRTTGT